MTKEELKRRFDDMILEQVRDPQGWDFQQVQNDFVALIEEITGNKYE